MVYSATFNGEVANEKTMPNVMYDSRKHAFAIYSEDRNLIGEKRITVTAHSSEYPTLKSDLWYDAISIVSDEGCSGQSPIEAPRQEFPPTYYYTGDSPSLKFELEPFKVREPAC